MGKKSNYYGLRPGSVTMETKIISAKVGSSGIFGSSAAKSRSVRVHVSGLHAVLMPIFFFSLLANLVPEISQKFNLVIDIYNISA